MAGGLIVYDVEIRCDGIPVFLDKVNNLTDGVIQFHVMCGGGFPEVVHDDGIGELVVGKELSVPVIDIAARGGNGDFALAAELKVVQIVFTIDDLQNEQSVNQDTSGSNHSGNHDQGTEIDFPKEITPKEACNMVINAIKKVNHLFECNQEFR